MRIEVEGALVPGQRVNGGRLGMLPRNRITQEAIEAAIEKGRALQKKIDVSLAFIDRATQLLTLEEPKTHDTNADAAKCLGMKLKAEPAPKPAPKSAQNKLTYETSNFVIIDLETTGLDARRNEIIEIAALKYTHGRFVEFQFLIKPQAKIPPFITNLTGITQAMVDKNGISEFHALKQFVEFVEDYPLIAYNAPFDRRFISASSEKHNLTIGNPYQCALEMAKKAFPNLKNHKLITICQSLQLAKSQAHRALADCHLTAAVYLKAAEIIDAVTESIPAA